MLVAIPPTSHHDRHHHLSREVASPPKLTKDDKTRSGMQRSCLGARNVVSGWYIRKNSKFVVLRILRRLHLSKRSPVAY